MENNELQVPIQSKPNLESIVKIGNEKLSDLNDFIDKKIPEIDSFCERNNTAMQMFCESEKGFKNLILKYGDVPKKDLKVKK
ncbi:hypothetical protein GW846_04715 [Candidatus Gracilibacteria bacterium]|nr:hypothetical protein [Candidatus Gracilibacteria bacterium]